MKHIPAIILLLTPLIFACNNQEAAREESSTKDNTEKTSSEMVCYKAEGRDTITLSFRTLSDSVVGTLRYNLYQKDQNNGSIFGRFNGDTLYAEYVFQSEGMDSRRQVAFLKKNDLLIQGIGPVEEKGNAQYFTNRSQIRFDSGIELRKTACQ